MTTSNGSDGYAVSVRGLCAFTAKVGDLDHRFTPSPTAQQGLAGHRIVASRRPPTYQTEVGLKGRHERLAVRGRADGYEPSTHRLEEIKTHRGDLSRMPANHRQLHWAQAETYAWLKCDQESLDAIDVALVYFDVASQVETSIDRRYPTGEVRALFEDRCRRFAAWADREVAHRVARDAALVAIEFPHGRFRAGQRELAEAVFRAARDGRHLMAQAPTGIGKTLGTLFPALKAMASQRIDKVFFLTAKTSGRQLALSNLKMLGEEGRLPLRVIELVSRETACEHPGKSCDGDSCPLARGFYDRLAGAREAAIATPFLDRAQVRKVAAEHEVCPYYLAQELVKWCDVVVGDYNHYFDSSAMLHAMTLEHEWRVMVLVDEAHNLVERARDMYSGELRLSALRAVTRKAPGRIGSALKRVDRCFEALVDQTADEEGNEADYFVFDDTAKPFNDSLSNAISTIGDWQAESTKPVLPELLQFFFDMVNFARLTESFGAHSMFDCSSASSTEPASATTGSNRDSVLCVRNIVPAPHLAPRISSARSVVLFSATLMPSDFYRSMLGLPENAVVVDVDSPFASHQLSVRIATHISTRYTHRSDSLVAIAALIAAQYDEAPGNYLAFFSSFDYMARVAETVATLGPRIPTWLQAPRMNEASQTNFLERFVEGGKGIGFAVLGGRFAEGIDLPGERLIGAFVATLGLPQVNPINERIRAAMQAQYGAGYEYTYLYPGLRKVVQAAGRVIRTTGDRGVIHLIDDRFARPEVRALLPRWWDVQAGAKRDGRSNGRPEPASALDL